MLAAHPAALHCLAAPVSFMLPALALCPLQALLHTLARHKFAGFLLGGAASDPGGKCKGNLQHSLLLQERWYCTSEKLQPASRPTSGKRWPLLRRFPRFPAREAGLGSGIRPFISAALALTLSL